jgi:hypothetical protein
MAKNIGKGEKYKGPAIVNNSWQLHRKRHRCCCCCCQIKILGFQLGEGLRSQNNFFNKNIARYDDKLR